MTTESQHQSRILIVEDDEDLREGMSRFLRFHGFDVSSAGSERQARDLFQQGPWDLAILDFHLPDRQGKPLVAELSSYPDLPVIVCTGQEMPDQRALTLESGADVYLIKPVAMSELLAVVSRLLRLYDGVRAREAADRPLSDAEAERPVHAWSKQAGKEASSAWMLSEESWSLIAPNGHAVKLTHSQFVIVQCLASQQGSVVPRDALVVALTEDQKGYDKRRLETSMARLRKRIVQVTGLAAPIETAYGRGYAWIGRIEVSEI